MTYYTRPEVSEKLNTSTVTIANYIKELQESISEEEYNEAFNDRNQPNDKGIKLLEDLQKRKNPNIRLFDEIEEKEEEIASIRADYEILINELKEDYQSQIVELNSDKAKLEEKNKVLSDEKEKLNDKFMDLYKETNDKLTELIHQSNTIAASLALANQKIEELESKTIETKTYESSYEEPEEKKSFFQKLFGK
ncbi:hypothetical protein ACF3NF_07845 (plasmid) [Anaerococcus martiniensis]|uniref:hypothetical protein n=1 Tax=Anaerococcus sp. WGS1579 TaxID=3366809 RepID=UPI00372D8627